MATACPHKRHVATCGQCPRRDIRVSDEVSVADDGTGASLTWFDGTITAQDDTGCITVTTELFGEGVWDHVKPKNPNAEVPAPASVSAAPVATATTTTAAAPAQTAAASGGVGASAVPLRAAMKPGLRVRVRGRDVVDAEFRQHRWTVSAELLARCGEYATVVESDPYDESVKLHFPTAGEEEHPHPSPRLSAAPLKNQWWPWTTVAIDSVEAAGHKTRLQAAMAPPTPTPPPPPPAAGAGSSAPAACVLPTCTRPGVVRCRECSTAALEVVLCGDPACFAAAHPVVRGHTTEPLRPWRPSCALASCGRPAAVRCEGCSTQGSPVYLCDAPACFDAAHPVVKQHALARLDVIDTPSAAADASTAGPTTAAAPRSNYAAPTHPRFAEALGADVEDALAAANAAVEVFTAPTPGPATDDDAAPRQQEECGHGVPKVECGRCPRQADLSIGDAVVVSDRYSRDTRFAGVVDAFHDTGYPLVRVDAFPADGAAQWDVVRAAPPPEKKRCAHGREDASYCGRCPHPEVPLMEEVEVSLNGEKWQRGWVAQKTPDGRLLIALQTGTTGFTWDFVRSPLLQPHVKPASPQRKRDCAHGKDPVVCGFCPRNDLHPGAKVKVAMGSNEDAAAFDGAVVEVTPNGTIVRTDLFGDMRWDRVWVPVAALVIPKKHYDATAVYDGQSVVPSRLSSYMTDTDARELLEDNARKQAQLRADAAAARRVYADYAAEQAAIKAELEAKAAAEAEERDAFREEMRGKYGADLAGLVGYTDTNTKATDADADAPPAAVPAAPAPSAVTEEAPPAAAPVADACSPAAEEACSAGPSEPQEETTAATAPAPAGCATVDPVPAAAEPSSLPPPTEEEEKAAARHSAADEEAKYVAAIESGYIKPKTTRGWCMPMV